MADSPNKLKIFLSKLSEIPYFGLLGTIFGIIGVILSISFYVAGKKEPELAFMINPIKTSVFSSDKASSIKIYKGQREITEDVTAIQIAIWNQGGRSIRANDILEPIEIYTEPPISIIETKVRNISRDVIKFQIETDAYGQGVIRLKWKILEKNDGASIQVIFSGPKSAKFRIRGIIEGQTQIFNLMETPNNIEEVFSFVFNIEKGKKKKPFGFDDYKKIANLVTITVFLVSVTILMSGVKAYKKKRRITSYIYFILFFLIFCLSLLYWLMNPPYPPISF